MSGYVSQHRFCCGYTGPVTYSAVVTTGIYCLPTCTARPRPENVQQYALAAAAEAAGFRACLRCRPYRAVEPVDWAGPELVCRAVQLILGGALDGGTEAELGARLGVSARHLRRLFGAQVGVTPDELARSRRAHFARRLLDDTDLPVADVAFASGFGSIRQLNRACLDVFRAPPGELRARRRKSDRLVADGGLCLRMPLRPPFDAPAMLAYFAPRAIPGVEAVTGGVYRRTIDVDGDTGVIELMAPGSASSGPEPLDHIVLRAHLPHWEGLIHLVERARRIMGLDTDYPEATERLAADDVLGPLVATRPGLRVPGAWDPFETGVRAIVGQQVTVAGASRLTGRIVERFGRPVAGLSQMGLTHTFPTAADLADGDLDGLGLTPTRQEAVRAFARSIATGKVRLDRSVGLEELIGSLTAIPGVGPWTANYLALRLGEPDAFPAADLGLRRGVNPADPPGGAALARMSLRWAPWRALAATHLWAAASAAK
ncbi:MAG: DNA-3-methyladenine glycosylase 2 family protein [Acidimicrobiaceae bacterium]|nr:DNA-3-methyladenine glycosylase 2 family protein [Acidimicrobiaceae bacterium]